MRNKIFSIIFILTLLAGNCSLNAQEGNLFVTNYKLEHVLDKQVFSITEDSYQCMLFATRKGILHFDSEDWQVIRTTDIPYVLEKDITGSRIFVGCRNDFGFLERSQQGDYLYQSLLPDSIYPGEVTDIVQTPSYVFFYSREGVFRVNKVYLKEWEVIPAEEGMIFNGLVRLGNKVYLNVYPDGLYDFDEMTLVTPESQQFIGEEEILFSIPYARGISLIGTGSNQMYLFDGTNLAPFKIEDQAYIDESYLVDGISVNDTCFAVSTIMGGCLLVSKNTGNTLYTINYRTGLPDDEIDALGFDSNKGIWLSHSSGLSRVDPFIPIRNFSTYPGISGRLFSSTVFNSKLYVSTNSGIFKLGEKKLFREEEVIIKVEPPPPVTPRIEDVPEPEPEPEPVRDPETAAAKDTEQDVSGLSKRELRKLRRQERREDRKETFREIITGASEEEGEGPAEGQGDQEEQPESEEEPAGTGEEKPGKEAVREIKQFFSSIVKKQDKPEEQQISRKSKREIKAAISQPSYKKKKIYSLQSISHEFVKIEGLDERSEPLLNYQDRILAGTHAGLYQIINDRAELVFENWYIEFLYLSPVTNRVYVGTLDKVYLIELVDGRLQVVTEFNQIDEDIFSVVEIREDLVWFGGYQNVYRIVMVDDEAADIRSYRVSSDDFEPMYLSDVGEDIIILKSSGTYVLRDDSLSDYTADQLIIEQIPVNHFTETQLSWILNNNDFIRYGASGQDELAANTYLNLFTEIQDIYFDPGGNIWVIHEDTHIDEIVVKEMAGFDQIFGLHIQGISNEAGNRYAIGDLNINYRDRSLQFTFGAPSFLKEQGTQYQYVVDNLTNEWSEWNSTPNIYFPVIPPGKYTLRVRARNVLRQTSSERSVDFTIDKPFWSAWWFIALMAIVLVLLVLLAIRLRVRKLERDKRILEHKVRLRTAEIERQKNEIAAQQKEIMDSIHYAQRIQNAVLPGDDRVNELLPENFILYLPRDIVSGDFYWMKQVDHYVIFAAADCTGHGVPGAFMSMLGISFLNEIVSKNDQLTANTILEKLRELVKTTLSQTGKEGEAKDGMDIALLIYDRKKRSCQFSGAYNPLYIIRNNELIQVRADRMPIGIWMEDEQSFSNHEVPLHKGDCLYVFSDGYADQIGGEKGKKFMSKHMKKLLLEIHSEHMARQKEILKEQLGKWMGGFQQVDDILVAGIRIP